MRRQASREIRRDDEPLFIGTHKGASSPTLRDPGANFRSLGVTPILGQYVENVNKGTFGAVLAATEDEVQAGLPGSGFPFVFPFELTDGIAWENGDEYRIYATSKKNSYISETWIDVSAGFKIEDHDDINPQGWRVEDWDLDDRGRKDVFGPGQPE